MTGNRRDLTIGIDGDAAGVEAAFEASEAAARGYDRELAKVERQQAAQEAVTNRAAAAVKKYAADMTGASLAAAKLGNEAQKAADKAEKAQIRSAAAAEAAKKGLLDEAVAARIAAQADEALERSALKAAAAQLALAKAAQKEAEAARGADSQFVRSEASVTRMRGGLTSAIAAAVGIAPPLIAAGAAAVGFAALAAPSIAKVVTAQKSLGTNWDSLSHQQKIAAVSLSGLIDQYKGLAKSYEPDATREFNKAIGLTSAILPDLGRTVDATKASFFDFTGQIEGSLGQQLPRLFAEVRKDAPPAFQELSKTFSTTADLSVNLVHDLAPLGQTLLHTGNGALSFLDTVTSLNPKLTEFAVAGLAMRGPVSGLTSLWDKASAGAKEFGAATKGASLAQKALQLVTKAGPGVFIAAAAGLAYLALRTNAVSDATDGMIDRLKGQYNAVGNNVRGYAQYASALKSQMDVLYQGIAHPENLAGAHDLAKQNSEIGEMVQKYKKLETAYNQAEKAQNNVTAGAAELGKEFNLNSAEAIQLANAAGIDMSKGILRGGELTAQARKQIIAYRAAVVAALDPTQRVAEDMQAVANKGLLMKDRIAALQDALAAYYGPAEAAWNATTQLKQGYAELAKAMKAAKGDFSGNTEKSRQLRQALSQQLDTVSALRTANLQTQGYTKAQAAAEQQLQVLYALAGKSKSARTQIDALSKSFGLSAGKSGISEKAFMAAAKAMSIPTKAAEALWRAYQKLPTSKNTKITSNSAKATKDAADYQAKLDSLHGKSVTVSTKAAAAKQAAADYQHKIDSLHGKTVTVNSATSVALSHIQQLQASINQMHGKTVTIETIEVIHHTAQAENAHADGGIDRYAGGGMRRDLPPHIQRRPTVLYGETETGGEAYIPLGTAKRSRSTMLLADVARMFGLVVSKRMADGGLLKAYADGGTDTGVSLSDVLSQWTDTVKPATKADVTAAKKAQRTQRDQLKSAEDALYKARHAKHPDRRKIAADERRVKKERQDLADATKKLTDAERRYQYMKARPTTQLSQALALNIKNTGAFVRNLETLAGRGFGTLANKLLQQGDPAAEKMAADAVKLSNSKLGKLQGQVQQADTQQQQLANLPNVLTAQSAIKANKFGGTWVGLLTATGLDPASLAAALNSMAATLNKTAGGKKLLADMHAHGYRHGGEIIGPPGTDQTLLRATAGEFMVNKAATAANRPLLDAINSGRRIVIPGPASPAAQPAAPGRAVEQHFHHVVPDAAQLARQAAVEAAWALR